EDVGELAEGDADRLDLSREQGAFDFDARHDADEQHHEILEQFGAVLPAALRENRADAHGVGGGRGVGHGSNVVRGRRCFYERVSAARTSVAASTAAATSSVVGRRSLGYRDNGQSRSSKAHASLVRASARIDATLNSRSLAKTCVRGGATPRRTRFAFRYFSTHWCA